MNNDSLEELSLFLHIEDPIVIYVIDNELIGCESYGGLDRSPERAYNLLIQLFSSKICRTVFPIRFAKFFKNKQPIKSNSHSECLVGFGEHFCLDVSLSIREKHKKPILLHDFVYKGIPTRFKAELTAHSAFYIFSNICANSRCIIYSKILEDSGYQAYNKEIIERSLKYRDSDTRLKFLPIDLFVLDYLEFIESQLNKGLITPLEILRLNGARILAFFGNIKPVSVFIQSVMNQILNDNSLSRNQKIMLWAFLNILYSNRTFHSRLIEFFEKNKDILAQIEKDVYKRFPQLEEEIYSQLV